MAFARTGGRWYVLAWCRLRRAGRWFLLARVRGVRITRERFEPRNLREVFGTPPEDAQPVKLA
jgi:predicted DNA-binding transcriptional regulator YafY